MCRRDGRYTEAYVKLIFCVLARIVARCEGIKFSPRMGISWYDNYMKLVNAFIYAYFLLSRRWWSEPCTMHCDGKIRGTYWTGLDNRVCVLAPNTVLYDAYKFLHIIKYAKMYLPIEMKTRVECIV